MCDSIPEDPKAPVPQCQPSRRHSLAAATGAVLNAVLLASSCTSPSTPSQKEDQSEQPSDTQTAEPSKQETQAPDDPSSSQEPTDPTSSDDQETSPSSGSEQITATKIKTPQWTFDALTSGPDSGELVLLLHGFPETSLEWTEQLKALGKAGYRAVAPDQRGYSPTARPTEISAYSNAKLVQDVLELADELGAKKFHLVGHDWGAGVAWGFAAKHPDRLHSLAPISVPHPDAFNEQLRDKSSCQYEASSYFDLFIQPNFEDTLLAFNAAGLRNTYDGLPPDRIEA